MKFTKFRSCGVFLLAAILSVIGLVVNPQSASAMKFFVANALGEVKPEEKVTPAKPKPVQVIFEFQRDGGPNPQATRQVKPWAIDDLKQTGAFADVVETPTADGAIISIKFNNIVIKEEMDKAKHQAFGAGLGFGLFGGVVAVDHYVVSMDYVPATGASPIHTEVKHELYAKYGNTKAPIPGTQAPNVNEAMKTLVRQALARGMNNIVSDPAFPR